MDLTTLGKEPIEGDKPAGINMSYEPEFEALQEEIDKMTNPSASESTDWEKVSKIAAEILSEKSLNSEMFGYVLLELSKNGKHQNQLPKKWESVV